MKPRPSFTKILLVVLIAAFAVAFSGWAVSLVGAQGPRPGDRASPSDAAATSSYLPIQGRLTDAGNAPVNGSVTMTLRLYDVWTGGTALCSHTSQGVPVVNGLFTAYMDAGGCPIDGRQLYLSIQVGTDAEMTPRQFVDNVPYAWSLRPGANISGTLGDAVLDIENWSSSGRGLRVYAMSQTGTNYAIVGAARSPNGYAAYLYNTGGGTAVYASSITGTAIYASSDLGPALVLSGTGIIRSAATTSLWISGNAARAYAQSDSTTINMDSIGGAFIRRGATVGNKNIILPVTIPGNLYGQNVRVKQLDIHWVAQTEFDGISVVLMRRQTGVCSTASCYVDLVNDPTDYICDIANHSTGCVTSINVTSNNTLSNTSGVLYLTLELAFSGASTYVEIGGVRLTLEHD